MKSKLAIVLALTSTAALAQDLQLGDLNFFQQASTVQWDTQLSFITTEYKDIFDNTDKTDFSEYETNSNVWQNRVTYGLADNLFVGLSFDYALKNETENTKQGSGNADPKEKSYDNKGLSDFTINSAYRLVNTGMYVDLTGDLTLGLTDREDGAADDTKSKDGNYNQGHHSFDLGVAVGQKIDAFEWRAGLNLDYHLAGEYDSLNIDDSATTVDTDARLDMSLNGQVQYRPITKLALGLGLDWTKVGEQTAEAKVNGDKIDITDDSYSILSTTLFAKYNLTDTALVNVGYSMISKYDIDNESKFQGATEKGTKEDVKASAFFIGGSFLF